MGQRLSKLFCRFHGELSTGPKTELGRQICAAAKTIHGDDSRLDRKINRVTMQRLRLFAQILGVPLTHLAGKEQVKFITTWFRIWQNYHSMKKAPQQRGYMVPLLGLSNN